MQPVRAGRPLNVMGCSSQSSELCSFLTSVNRREVVIALHGAAGGSCVESEDAVQHLEFACVAAAHAQAVGCDNARGQAIAVEGAGGLVHPCVVFAATCATCFAARERPERAAMRRGCASRYRHSAPSLPRPKRYLIVRADTIGAQAVGERLVFCA